MKKLLILWCFAVLFSSCEKMFLGPDEPNTPENNFELLWKDFDQHYSLFYIKGTNWDSLYQVYRPQVKGSTNQYELWRIMTSLLAKLNDSHTVLFYESDRKNYSSGFALGEKATEEFSLDLVKSKYTDGLTKVESEEDLHYGKIRNKNIGYIYIRKEIGKSPEKAIVDVISKLKNHKAIIVDLRNNAGGYAQYSKIIAGAFADGEHLVGTVQVRNGPNHSDFDDKTNEITQRTGREQFLKPVIVVTDRATISGGEYITLHLKSFANVTQIGDTTAGDFGATSMRRFLPNGWSYTYSIKMFLLPDGTSLDGKGIKPDIYAKNTISDMHNGKDAVLEKSVDYLFVRYGIQ